MRYKCNVIRLSPANTFDGSCDNTATNEIYGEDIEAVNENFDRLAREDKSGGYPGMRLHLVGNYICEGHTVLMFPE